MTRNTDGYTRTVFLIRRWAIKVPCCRYGWRMFLNGMLANMQERAWSKAKFEGLLPVVLSDCFGFFVVMPRVVPINRELTEEQFASFCDRGEYHIPAENKAGHFAYWKGKLVTLDYGGLR